MSTIEKIVQIRQLIGEIDQENPKIGMILLEGFDISLRTLQAVAEKNERESLDIGEYIEIICRALDVDLKDIVNECVKEMTSQNTVTLDGPPKEADKDTLDFITSDLDDYEKFVAQNKAKESLDFLSKEL
jgi:DNA-directed RNA polymerase specialized sigma subunit